MQPPVALLLLAAGTVRILGEALVAEFTVGRFSVPFVIVACRPIRAVRAEMPGVLAVALSVFHRLLPYNPDADRVGRPDCIHTI